MATTMWTTENISDQQGKLAVVTGGNSGIGYEAAKALAGKGSQIVLAVRSAAKGKEAVDGIRREHPKASVEVMLLDLSDLDSTRRFAEAFLKRYSALPLLINNAGVMGLPFRKTPNGFEMQFGTNHLGHFALTGLLLPAILAAKDARVVTISSGLHVRGTMNFADLNSANAYSPSGAYSQSKLANLLFAYELQRHFATAGVRAISIGCHPGYAATNLQSAGPLMSGSRVQEAMMRVANRLLAQSPAMGALPTLYAATAADVNGCDYIGPTGLAGMRGYPAKVKSSERSYDLASAKQLWQMSEEMSGVRYDLDLAKVTH